MDSLPIIEHLEKVFPSPSLFPSGASSVAISIAVKELVTRSFYTFKKLAVPKVSPHLDPRGQEYFERTRKEWFGMPLQEMYPSDETSFEEAWKPFATEAEVLLHMLRGMEGKKGPFFEGEKVGWADLFLVSHFAWVQRVNPSDWEKIAGLGNGEFKALYDACQPWLGDQGKDREWPIPHSAA